MFVANLADFEGGGGEEGESGLAAALDELAAVVATLPHATLVLVLTGRRRFEASLERRSQDVVLGLERATEPFRHVVGRLDSVFERVEDELDADTIRFIHDTVRDASIGRSLSVTGLA